MQACGRMVWKVPQHSVLTKKASAQDALGRRRNDPQRPASAASSSAELAEIDARLHALQSFLKAAKANCDMVH